MLCGKKEVEEILAMNREWDEETSNLLDPKTV